MSSRKGTIPGHALLDLETVRFARDSARSFKSLELGEADVPMTGPHEVLAYA